MALTEAQLYNLAVGDEVIVHGKCEDVYGNKDIRVNTYWTVAGEKREQSFLVHSSCISIPPEKPKYDPCRLFKKGDIVEMDAHGRDIAASMKKSGVELGERYTVTEDENNTGYVSFIGDDRIEHHSMFFWLKLVTPVEELEPYELVETTDYWSVEKENEELCLFWKKHHPNAKEAAEAECDRLNTEWRKEKGTLKND